MGNWLSICQKYRQFWFQVKRILLKLHEMSIERAIEEKILKAIEAGDFDNLRGMGKPLDLTAYFNTPEDLRLAYALLKSNEFVPEEVEMLREITILKEKIEACSNDEDRNVLIKKLNEQNLAFSVAIEKYKKRKA